MRPYTMLMLAIATSIDALAVGVTFAFMDIDLLPSVTLIGITTFLFSAAGVKVGSLFGTRYKNKAECSRRHRSHPDWPEDIAGRLGSVIKKGLSHVRQAFFSVGAPRVSPYEI